MLKRLPLVLSLLLFTHCAAGAIREHSLDSSEIQNSTSEKVLVWQEGPSGDSRVRRVDSGIFTSSFRELSEYSSWLNQSPVDCDGFASRQYWARRSYPIFFRWKDTRGPRLDATDDSRSLQEAKEAYGPENETGAPANTSLADQSFRRIFLSFRNAGMLISDDGGKSFRRSDLPRRFVGEKEAGCDPELYRDVVGVWQHPRDSRIILAVNIQDLLLSMDGGRTFRAIEFRGLSHLKSRNIFASVAASLEGGKINRIYLGTAYNGIKVLTISESELLAYQRNERPFSARVRDMNRGLPGLLHEPGVVFYEHILDLRWIPETGSLIAATLFDPGLAIVSTRREGAEFRFVRLPGAETDTVSESLDCNSEGCTLSSSNSAFFFPLESADHFGHPISLDSSSEGAGARDSGAREFPSNASSSSEKGDHVKKEKNVVSRDFVATVRGPYLNHTGPSLSHRPAPSTEVKRPEVLNAFYISPTSARLKQALVFHLIEKYGFNAAVIDVKDDFGRLTYGSNLPIAREMNNTREIAPVRQLVKELKERGIYTIARQVVFKDLRMHRYKGHRNAIKNRYSGGPWTVEGDEQWTDPFSAEVQTYNLDVAREVLDLGFDEIQFDYIRFPSDGPIYQCYFSHAPEGAYRTEAIESFLRRARFSLNAPISIDIFGYNAIYRAGAVIGQDVLEMGSAVNFVSPMHYSSHFGTHYLNQYPREERVHRLLEIGTERPLRMSRGLFSLRPWLQAFPMMNHIWGYGHDYMIQQMQGSLDGGASGFLFWGPIAEFPIAGRAYKEDIEPELRRP